MSSLKKKSERNGASKTLLPSIWSRTISSCSTWPDKDEFLDVIYWARQILGVILGIIWGLLPLQGFLGILLFCFINAFSLYAYAVSFQKVDEDIFGGMWELVKEGFMTSFAGFLVTWIMIYSAIHFE